MSVNSDSNKRIAKNTLLLYIRMFITMAVSLYTSRVVINALGVTDYGIYGVVGGFVTMLTFMNGAMSAATQRYISFSLGRDDLVYLKKVFRTSVQIHVFVAIIIFVLGETIGLWFVKTQLVIPVERLNAALWVYQFSLLICVATIVCLPYNAVIIAHEHMKTFAYISMLDVILKLAIVYALLFFSFDKLIFYSFLLLCVALFDQLFYVMYCKRNFEEINFSFCFDRKLLKEMSGFAGWSLWGSISHMLYTQGLNILLNLFFGPAVNAARSIAVSVQGVIQGFATNIQLAMNPQITKSYAVGDLNRMHQLMIASSKFCFYLLLLIILPIAFETKFVLFIWLGVVPEHAAWFLRLILSVVLLETLVNPYMIANQATGKVKLYQSVCGGILLLIVPVSYLCLKVGGSPESVFFVQIIISTFTQFVRVYMMRNLIDFPISKYIKDILVPILGVSVMSSIFPLLIYLCLPHSPFSIVLLGLGSIIFTLIFIFCVGLTKGERSFIITKANYYINNLLHR